MQVLERIWEIYGRICSKRLHRFLPEAVKVLERCHKLSLSAETKLLLLSMSRATIDLCLKKACWIQPQHGRSTPKPGSLLKQAIPIRTFTPWEDERPGFLEIDLVAHCGSTTQGVYLNTLTSTDLTTGWTQVQALANKTQAAVLQAMEVMRHDLPFRLLGLDSDNGSEFTLAPHASAGVNDYLYRYCLAQRITFTRSRPYQKNDQALVDQINWSAVRHTIGKDRLDTPEELALLNSIYTDLRL